MARPKDLAERLDLAIRESGLKPTAVGQAARLPEGHIFKLLGVGKAKQVLEPGPSTLKSLATVLGVRFAWLAIGEEPQRDGDWSPSPFDRAAAFARRAGLRDDAITAAAAVYDVDDETMSDIDWIVAFDAQASRLERRTRAVDAKRRLEAAERELAELRPKTAKKRP